MSWFIMALTFSQVQPIFQKRCMPCHVEKRWNWTDYETAYKHRNKIVFRVYSKNMPPGNITGMTDDERKKIKAWVMDGAQK